jgi:hypothetical protein
MEKELAGLIEKREAARTIQNRKGSSRADKEWRRKQQD